MKALKTDLEDLERSVTLILKKKMFSPDKKYDTFNYEEKQKGYLKKEVELKINKISNFLLKPETKEMPFLQILPELKKDFDEIKKEVNKFNEISLEGSIDKIGALIEKISQIKETKEKREFFLPQVPKEIKQEAQANFEELMICFDNHCFRSSLILCGKILEIALHRKYFEITGKDLLEKSPDIGLGNVLAKMRESNIEFDPGLAQQIHLINQLRVFSVHKKSQVFSPSKEQTKATILYTLDILNKLFKL